MPASPNSDAQFTQTHWSVVLAARNWQSREAAEALAKLCQAYWYPIYAFIRRRGHSPHEAQDLTQDFFVHLFEQSALESVDRQKGKFRSFLLAVLTNFLNADWRRRNALKRGGGQAVISLDEIVAENRFSQEPADLATPEASFERHWARSLVQQVMDKLRAEYAASDKTELYAAFEQALTGETSASFFAKAAASLRMSEGAVRVALHRFRRRFGQLLRNEVAQTVADPAEIDDEIRHLLAALAR